MSESIIEQSKEIFGTIEKWQAFHEMQLAIPTIVNHWLEIGAAAMREEFSRTAGKWACANWGSDRDTRWYLEDLKQESISLGIGWETFELHLFDGRGGESTWKTALDLLSHQDFTGLKERIDHRGARAYAHTYRTLLSDLQFDPFSSGHGEVFRPRFIAWMAAHKTDEFVEVTLARIRTLLDDEEFIRLVRDLTQRSACDFPE